MASITSSSPPITEARSLLAGGGPFWSDEDAGSCATGGVAEGVDGCGTKVDGVGLTGVVRGRGGAVAAKARPGEGVVGRGSLDGGVLAVESGGREDRRGCPKSEAREDTETSAAVECFASSLGCLGDSRGS